MGRKAGTGRVELIGDTGLELRAPWKWKGFQQSRSLHKNVFFGRKKTNKQTKTVLPVVQQLTSDFSQGGLEWPWMCRSGFGFQRSCSSSELEVG